MRVNIMSRLLPAMLCAAILVSCDKARVRSGTLYSCNEYAVFPDSVVEKIIRPELSVQMLLKATIRAISLMSIVAAISGSVLPSITAIMNWLRVYTMLQIYIIRIPDISFSSELLTMTHRISFHRSRMIPRPFLQAIHGL